MKRLLILVSVVISISSSAQERRPEDYERILAPAGSTAGAFGAQWSAEVVLRNDSDRAVDVYPVNERFCPVSIACYRSIIRPPALGPRETAFSFSGRGIEFASVGDATPAGYFIYVERGRANDLSMQLHATDRSRTPPEITQLPLVHESEFFSSTRSIASVPLSATQRVSLRVFQLDPSMPDSFVLRVFETAPSSLSPFVHGALLAERRLRFTPGALGCVGNFFSYFGCPAGFVYHPGYVLIANLLSEFPELTSAVDRPFGIRIEIEPAPGLRFWPLVTVTDNATNHVTVYTVR